MWEEKNNKLVKTFTFKDFDEAWAFMSKVAEIAKKMDHHPTWTNKYNIVSFELYTHTAGKVTDNDHKLADAIDKAV
ncbi:MAG: 4a-hydroxytetrahydrobiopterin dehydratase [FCB group bacterium]|jgi:4a-hydroxytetrahydrobiopterin dehydratase